MSLRVDATPMAQLVFHCPYTNQPIFSGIEAGADSLKPALDYPISLRCPHCGLQHHGTVADGYLTEEGESSVAPRVKV